MRNIRRARVWHYAALLMRGAFAGVLIAVGYQIVLLCRADAQPVEAVLRLTVLNINTPLLIGLYAFADWCEGTARHIAERYLSTSGLQPRDWRRGHDDA